MNNNTTTGKKSAYIVVLGISHDIHYLQYRSVVSSGFYNNTPKLFKTLGIAKRVAKTKFCTLNADYAQVWQIYDGENLKNIIRHESDRCMFMIQRVEE